MHNYKKHFKADGSFVIKEYRENGKARIVGEDNSCYMAFLEAGNTPEDIEYVAPAVIDPTVYALARNRFTKLEIRRALRELGIESQLDGLLNISPEFNKDWLDATEIILDDPVTVLALQAASFDIDAIKLKIAGL